MLVSFYPPTHQSAADKAPDLTIGLARCRRRQNSIGASAVSAIGKAKVHTAIRADISTAPRCR